MTDTPKDEDTNSALSEDKIREIMRDPRYWRDRDPELIDRVNRSFDRLFPVREGSAL